MPKLHAHLQTMTKEPAVFQTDRYKTYEKLCPKGTHHLSSNASVKKGYNSARRTKMEQNNTGPLFFIRMLYMKIQDPSSNQSWLDAKRNR